uniref:FERM domain-containing protein n=1 Tax=Ciona savignyi TaxID=51511 RepID=H2ZN56_CIOSA
KMPLNLLKKKKKGKQISVKISTLDADLNFSVDSFSKANYVFDLVCHTIGLRETWYFGLAYTGKNGSLVWLKLDKRIIDQNVPRSSENGSVELKFFAKFYPEVLDVELIQEVTRHLFYLQLQQLVLSEKLTCTPEAAILLASYAVQAKFGDYDEEIHKPGFLANEVLLPQQVIDQYQSVTGQMWEAQITPWYAGHHGLTRDEAELEYLKIVQEFEMSGVEYFKIKDGNGLDLWLGIDAKSISMYPFSDKLHHTKSYQWSQLADMSYCGNKFVIKQTQKLASDLVFLVDDPEVNKVILDLCRGNHELFMQRRSVDSMEIQQMKEQAREEKARKQLERTRLEKEKNLRLMLQNEKKEIEEKLLQFQEEHRSTGEALRRSEETADLLEKAKVAEEEALLLRAKLGKSDQELQSLKLEIVQLKDVNHQLSQKLHKYEQYVQQLNEQGQARTAEMSHIREELYATQSALNEANMKLNLNLYLKPFLATTLGIDKLSVFINGQSLYYCIVNPDMQQLSQEIEKERVEYHVKSRNIEQQLFNLRSEIEVLKVDE